MIGNPEVIPFISKSKTVPDNTISYKWPVLLSLWSSAQFLRIRWGEAVPGDVGTLRRMIIVAFVCLLNSWVYAGP